MFRFVLTLAALIAAHPLQKKPYNAIKFVRVNGNGIALYTVKGDDREMGAKLALKAAFERFGAHCFHCEKWMEPQKLSYQCTRDHRHRKAEGERALAEDVARCIDAIPRDPALKPPSPLRAAPVPALRGTGGR